MCPGFHLQESRLSETIHKLMIKIMVCCFVVVVLMLHVFFLKLISVHDMLKCTFTRMITYSITFTVKKNNKNEGVASFGFGFFSICSKSILRVWFMLHMNSSTALSWIHSSAQQWGWSCTKRSINYSTANGERTKETKGYFLDVGQARRRMGTEKRKMVKEQKKTASRMRAMCSEVQDGVWEKDMVWECILFTIAYLSWY